MNYEFKAVESLSLENSYGTIKEQKDINLHCTIGIKDEEYGWFEIYDEESGGDEWYAEGGLWFKGKRITMYDGVFALPRCILQKLEEIGYNISEIE